MSYRMEVPPELKDVADALVEAVKTERQTRLELSERRASAAKWRGIFNERADSIRSARDRLARAKEDMSNGLISADQLELIEQETAPLIAAEVSEIREAMEADERRVEELTALLAEQEDKSFAESLRYDIKGDAELAAHYRIMRETQTKIDAIIKAFRADSILDEAGGHVRSRIKESFKERYGLSETSWRTSDEYLRPYRAACSEFDHEPIRFGSFEGLRPTLPAAFAFANKRPLSATEEREAERERNRKKVAA